MVKRRVGSVLDDAVCRLEDFVYENVAHTLEDIHRAVGKEQSDV